MNETHKSKHLEKKITLYTKFKRGTENCSKHNPTSHRQLRKPTEPNVVLLKMASFAELSVTPGEPQQEQLYKLSDLLDLGWKLYEELDKSDEPSGSDSVQMKVRRGTKHLEEAEKRIQQLQLFRYLKPYQQQT